VEQRQQRAYTDDFIEQFLNLLKEHWVEIVLVINRQSPRLSALLRATTPAGLKRSNGGWRVQVATHSIVQRENLHAPRDNEIVAQAIRLYYHQAAQFKLPRITVEFTYEGK